MAVGVDSTTLEVGGIGLIVDVVDVSRPAGESGEVVGVLASVIIPVIVHPARDTKMTHQPAIDIWNP